MKKLNEKEWPVVWQESKGGPLDNRYTVTAGLHQLKGNACPYFSFTIDYFGGGGADLELIAELWPELEKFLPLHLSDHNGKPMHAYENGRYWFGMTEYQEFDAVKAARHFRDTPDNMRRIKDRIEAGEVNLLSDYVAGCEERWKAEADECIEALKNF